MKNNSGNNEQATTRGARDTRSWCRHLSLFAIIMGNLAFTAPTAGIGRVPIQDWKMELADYEQGTRNLEVKSES